MRSLVTLGGVRRLWGLSGPGAAGRRVVEAGRAVDSAASGASVGWARLADVRVVSPRRWSSAITELLATGGAGPHLVVGVAGHAVDRQRARRGDLPAEHLDPRGAAFSA